MGISLHRLTQFWAARSLAVGALATALDLSVVLTCVEVFGAPRVPGVALGVSLGASTGFWLNKHFAFKDQSSGGKQALRYGLLLCFELLLHTSLVTTFIHLAGAHYLAAKLGADFIVFTCVHLLALRYLVFPRPTAQVGLSRAPSV
jgi:putative flippase GtrA